MSSRSALVLVDVQHGFVDERTRRVLDPIRTLLGRRWGLVVATQFTNMPGSLYRSELDWHDMSSGTHGQQTLGWIDDAADVVVTKSGYSAAASLMPELSAVGITEATLAGVDTDACVLATAFGLWDAGIRVCIEASACASGGGLELHNSALNIARQVFGPTSVVEPPAIQS